MIRQTGRLAAGAVRSFLNTGLMVVSKEILGSPSSAQGRVAVVASRYNESITNRLVEGAIETLKSNGFSDDQIDLARVPGAWELPLIAQRFAESQSYIAVVCLGAVIKGETTHDEYINHQVAQSLGQIALDNDIPVAFGLLTCQTLEQALNRAGGAVGNKGEEATLAALEMADLLTKLPGLE